MREALIYAVAMGLLAFGGGFSGPPLPLGEASACTGDCSAPVELPVPIPVTKF